VVQINNRYQQLFLFELIKERHEDQKMKIDKGKIDKIFIFKNIDFHFKIIITYVH
jgi:hypothetical protein